MRSHRCLLPILGALLLILVGGCGGDGDDVTAGDSGDRRGGSTQPEGDDPLAGKTLVATGVTEGGEPYALVPGTEVRLGFDDGRISVDAGCNHMSGTYRIEGGALVVSNLAGTEMGCDQDRMDQDRWLAEVLGRKPAVATEAGTVTLTAGDTVLTLADREAVSPDRPLIGTEWVLDSLIEGTGESGTASSLPQGVSAGVTFGEDGTYRLSAGCNTGGGSYSTSDGSASEGTIDIGTVALTRRACDEAAMSVEAAVTAVFDGDPTYEIDERTLTLTNGDKGLGFRTE